MLGPNLHVLDRPPPLGSELSLAKYGPDDATPCLHHAHSAVNGENCPHVRCDMVFYETPNGGAVFSTSSIAFAGSLAHNNYANNVSRLLENVVRRFLDSNPFPAP